MNYFETKDTNSCCSCGACSLACPQQCITLVPDKCGVKYPQINESKCIKCKKCERVCPIINAENVKTAGELKSYALLLNDEKEKIASASGGAFSAIIKAYGDVNTFIYGAEMKDCKVLHGEAKGIEDAKRFRKSKYVKSELSDTFLKIKNRLENNKKVVFSGTPCQVAALKCYLSKKYENLLTVEVVCHGVPSQKLFDSYIRWMEKRYHKNVTDVKMRQKDKKGDMYGTEIIFDDGKTKTLKSWQNPWMLAYSKLLMFMDSCYSCPFASEHRVADLTIGDLWGGEEYLPEWDHSKGASLVLANSEKGREIMNNLKDVQLKEYDFAIATKKNPNLIKPTKGNAEAVKNFKEEAVSDFEAACKKRHFLLYSKLGRMLNFLPTGIKRYIKKRLGV